MNKVEFIDKVIHSYYPNSKCELIYNKDYELVLAVMLSAQCTDKRVNEVTPKLFSKYDTLEKLNKLSISDIECEIKSLGMVKAKSLYFKEIVSSLLLFGEVPKSRKKLENLPGIGRKCANVILSTLYGIPCIAVDTHVARVSKRLGLAKEVDGVLDIEKKLMRKFPKYRWSDIHHELVLFGRYRCTAKRPLCSECLLKDICKYNKKDFHV